MWDNKLGIKSFVNKALMWNNKLGIKSFVNCDEAYGKKEKKNFVINTLLDKFFHSKFYNSRVYFNLFYLDKFVRVYLKLK